jgi:hypothetical protein
MLFRARLLDQLGGTTFVAVVRPLSVHVRDAVEPVEVHTNAELCRFAVFDITSRNGGR